MDGNSLEQRVAALERQNRRLRAAVGVIVALVSVPILAGAVRGESQTDVVRASRFQVASNGKIVAEMSADDAGGLIRIWHKTGTATATLSSKLNGGGSLTVWDYQGRRAGYLAAGPWGGSLDISKNGETVGYFDAVRAGEGSVGAAICVGKTANGCAYNIPAR